MIDAPSVVALMFLEHEAPSQSPSETIWQRICATVEVHTCMACVLRDKGFAAIPAQRLGGSSRDLAAMAMHGAGNRKNHDNLQERVKAVAETLRGLSIPYASVGMVGPTVRRTDTLTGNAYVHTIISGHLLDLSSAASPLLMPLGPLHGSAYDIDPWLARQAATLTVAEAAARQIVDLLTRCASAVHHYVDHRM